MVAVPGAIPVTRPAPLTVATAVFVLLHTPPLVELASVVVDATHSMLEPEIEPARVSEVSVSVAVDEPQELARE